MEYFCPHCQKRHHHTKIAVGLDNSVLDKALKQIPPETREGIIEQYDKRVNDLMEHTKEPTLLVGTLIPDGRFYRINIGQAEVLEAIKFGIRYLKERRAANVQNMISENDLNGIELLYKKLLEYREFPIYSIPNILAIVAPDTLGNPIFRSAPGSFKKLCGECHQPLFQFAGEGQEIVIGLLGSERMGKSTCIVSTIASFLQDAANATGLVLDTPNDADTRWGNIIKTPLLTPYKHGWSVLKTQLYGQDSIFCASLKARIPHSEPIILTFVDMPGEIMHNDTTGLAEQFYTRYLGLYANVDAFWFCIDGDQLTQTTSAQGGHDATGKQDMSHIVDPGALSANLQAIKAATIQYSPSHRMPPAAIIFTKSDMAIFHQDKADKFWWDPLPAPIYKRPENRDVKAEAGIYEDRGLYHNGNGTCYLFEEAFSDTSKAIRRALYNIGVFDNPETYDLNFGYTLARNIISILEDSFSEHAYFSTSAYSRDTTHAPKIVYRVGSMFYSKFDAKQGWEKFSEEAYFTAMDAVGKGYGHVSKMYSGETLEDAPKPVLVLINGSYATVSELNQADQAQEKLQWEAEKCDKGAPRPFRANLPLLWTLAALGRLKVKAEVEMKPRNTLANILKKTPPYTDSRLIYASRDEKNSLENAVHKNLCSSTFTEHEELF